MIQSIIRYFKRFGLPGMIAGSAIALGLAVFFFWAMGKMISPFMQRVCKSYLANMDDELSASSDRTVAVEVKSVQIGPISKRIHAVGTLKANKHLEIKPQISGRVKKIVVEAGAKVELDEELILLDDEELQAQLKQSQALYKYYKAEHNRMVNLRNINVESEKKLQEAESQMDQNNAKIEEIKIRINHCVIKAPFDGMVGIPKVVVGDYVQQGAPILSLVQNNPIYVDTKIPEQYFSEIGVGQEVEVKVGALSGKVGFEEPLLGKIIAVEPKSEAESHSIPIRIELSNDSADLQHGMYCSLNVITGENTDATYIDEAAIETLGNIEYVWVVERGKATQRRVLTGTRDKGQVEIVAGLKKDELVVIAGQLRLFPGVRVRILSVANEKETADLEKANEFEKKTSLKGTKKSENSNFETIKQDKKTQNKKD
jgi:membrane fusion protein (multidrug efflux system)